MQSENWRHETSLDVNLGGVGCDMDRADCADRRAATGEAPLLNRPADNRDRQNNIEFVDGAQLAILSLRFQGGISRTRLISTPPNASRRSKSALANSTGASRIQAGRFNRGSNAVAYRIRGERALRAST